MNTRAVALAVGVAAVALGVVFVVAPGFAGTLGTNRTAIFALGALALLLGVRAGSARRAASRESASLPEVESRVTFDRPGADRTDRLRTAASSRMNRDRRELREDLRETAMSVLTAYGGYTTADAEAALRDGTWTDDPHAAAFFARTTPTRPLRIQLRDVVRGTAAFDRRATRAVAELSAIAEEA
ncbi:DUF7269 family protein [Salarchaeum japonicum]|uniref:DUF7269 family protein n=1 Tax=Salarchaeum japonicum TaxID=555573 RepID=UPI003C76465D